ncbi:MAG: hypothetical protein AVDCRST_MAG70-935 [uncultured Thermomicrobiales bacterium]|uniref:Uncharacterized protein n=1 Tax=uncultured Thermomicrobiales bacterium TaxID=1645740 RepID=A0A6J4UHX0_9BACT|nr:MAG: hypothetical protein AVDCRST_MAG70-935 [uncultured Thermomicrobiales bacterium]
MSDVTFTTGFMIDHLTTCLEADAFDDLSPAEMGLLGDLIRAARPTDHPDRWGLVTDAERTAFLAEADRETERRRLTREAGG